MYNKKTSNLKTHFLKAIDSIEVNLQVWQQYRVFPVSYQGIYPQNA